MKNIIKNMLKSNMSDEEILQLAGSLEAKSTHPIAKAFTEYSNENNIKTIEVQEFESVSGFGIKGKIKSDEIVLGNSKIIEKYNIENNHLEDEKILSEEGNSIIYVAKNNEIIAMIGVNDIIRDNVKTVIEELSKNNIETIMLTGDNEEVANKVAQEIGITKVIANVIPSEKAKIIKDIKSENKIVMMCGDGINDSPALANSDIGVSVKSGTDIAMDSSDVILMKNDLKSVIKLREISKNTVKIIKQNLFWAFFYNCLMIPVAIGVLKPIGISINPMIASFAMVLSSVTVILNTLRLRKLNKEQFI
mgnify:CR=1 FL=1